MSTHFLPVFGLLILFVKITQKKYPPKQKYLIFIFILPSKYVNIMLKTSLCGRVKFDVKCGEWSVESGVSFARGDSLQIKDTQCLP